MDPPTIRPGLLLFLLALVSTSISTALAQSPPTTTTTTNTAATPAATIHSRPGSGYVYHGCYNETTGLAGTAGNRALYDGANLVAPGEMTVERCWDFCRTGAGDSAGGKTARFTYAGLEYARECWCAQALSSLSEKLPDSACDLPCEGNNTQACGGNLKLTVYIANAAPAARVAWAAGLVAVVVVAATLV